MAKYDRKLIKNYILGNDIEDYNIDELEKDYEFIIQVIEESNDKNMLNICSDEMFMIPEFILYIIDKFKTDRKLTTKIVLNYLRNSYFDVLDTNMIEMIVKMADDRPRIDLYDDLSDELVLEMYLGMAYKLIHDGINAMGEKDHNGLGFIYITCYYADSKIIKDYFAKEFVTEIFEDIDEIQKSLHDRYKKNNIIEKLGFKKFLIEYVRTYDEELSDYISFNLNLVPRVLDKIRKMSYEWDYFIEDNEEVSDSYLIEYIEEEFDKHCIGIDLETVYRYLSKQLNNIHIYDIYRSLEDAYESLSRMEIEEAIMEDDSIDCTDVSVYNARYEESNELSDVPLDNYSFETRRWLIELKSEVREILKGNFEEDTYIRKINEEKEEEEKENESRKFLGKVKIIEFKPKNNE